MTTWAPTSRFLKARIPDTALGTSIREECEKPVRPLMTEMPVHLWHAAERLARLVKNIKAPDDHDRVVAVGRLSPPAGQMSTFGKEEIEEEAQRIAWARKAPLCRNLLVDEATRVLGE